MKFKEYLQQLHMEEFPQLLDDDLPDAFDGWLGELNPEDFIKYGENYKNLAGIKDENGIAVKAGDIVEGKVNNYVWRYLVTKVDDFGDSLYLRTRYRNFKIDNETDEHIFGDFYFDYGRKELNGKIGKIIGNIKNNKELLEQVK